MLASFSMPGDVVSRPRVQPVKNPAMISIRGRHAAAAMKYRLAPNKPAVRELTMQELSRQGWIYVNYPDP